MSDLTPQECGSRWDERIKTLFALRAVPALALALLVVLVL